MARRWGYDVKGIPADQANIVTMEGNFHGRTTTVVSFSTDDIARRSYGPYTPGFRVVPYGDLEALDQAIDEHTAAVLLEVARHEVLMMADEVQSGLARTGRTFACDHEDVVPDIYVMGKALGGGLLPVSAIAADHYVMDVITPGSHGSTFGGNPLAAAVGLAVCELLESGEHQRNAAELEGQFLDPMKSQGAIAIHDAAFDIDHHYRHLTWDVRAQQGLGHRLHPCPADMRAAPGTAGRPPRGDRF